MPDAAAAVWVKRCPNASRGWRGRARGSRPSCLTSTRWFTGVMGEIQTWWKHAVVIFWGIPPKIIVHCLGCFMLNHHSLLGKANECLIHHAVFWNYVPLNVWCSNTQRNANHHWRSSHKGSGIQSHHVGWKLNVYCKFSVLIQYTSLAFS